MSFLCHELRTYRSEYNNQFLDADAMRFQLYFNCSFNSISSPFILTSQPQVLLRTYFVFGKYTRTWS